MANVLDQTEHPSPTPTAAGDSGKHKITIELPAAMADDMKQRAKARGITLTELIRRAVAIEKFIFENGGEATVTTTDGDRKTIVIM